MRLNSELNLEPRLLNEIENGRKILKDFVRYQKRATEAGKDRWIRKVGMLTFHIKPKMKVLEVGCGTGALTEEILKKQAQIIAVDISPELIKAAESKIKSRNLLFLIDSAYNLSLRDDSFDTIVGCSILHHLDINKALAEFYRVLKPGGTVCFTEPNMLNPQIAIQKNIPFIKRLAGDSPNETAFFRWNLKKKLEFQGFKHIQIKSFDFLHPNIPSCLISIVKCLGDLAESTPILSEIAGSLYIRACK